MCIVEFGTSNEFGCISHFHLKKQHDMTITDYKNKFPTAPMYSDVMLKKIAENTRKQHVNWKIKDPEGYKQHQAEAAASMGKYERTDVIKKRVSETLQEYYKKNKHPQLGKTLSDKHKKKLSEIRLSQIKSGVYIQKGINWSIEDKKRIAEDVRKLWEDPEYRKMQSEAHMIFDMDFPRGNLISEKRMEAYERAAFRSEVSGEADRKLHCHHIASSRRFIEFILDDEFLSIFELEKKYNGYLVWTIFKYVIPKSIMTEMNRLENMIILTCKEHREFEGMPITFFEEIRRVNDE
jgi:hypothetical protein